VAYHVRNEKVKNVGHSTAMNIIKLCYEDKIEYEFASGLCVPLYWLCASVVKKYNHGGTERTEIHGVLATSTHHKLPSCIRNILEGLGKIKS
jgi:hypothetical protein